MTAKTLLDFANSPIPRPAINSAVLLLIDHQLEYTIGKLRLAGVDDAVNEIASLIQIFRQASRPIIHVFHHARPGSALFDPEDKMVQPISTVAPMEGEEIVIKSLPNAFAKTNLDLILKSTGK